MVSLLRTDFSVLLNNIFNAASYLLTRLLGTLSYTAKRSAK